MRVLVNDKLENLEMGSKEFERFVKRIKRINRIAKILKNI